MTADTLNPSLEGLTDRLAQHKACFDSLVELIPPKYYLTTDNDNEPTGKFAYNKKNKAPKQAIKEATKKAKKAKLDPENYKSVLDIQSEAAQAEKEKVEDEIDQEKEDDDVEKDEDEMEVDEEASAPSVKPLPKGSILELQEKIQKRIAELAAKRGGAGKGGKPGETPPRSRQEILDKRAKRKAEKKAATLIKKEKKKKGDDTTGMSVPMPARDTKDEKPVADAVSFGKLDFGVPESASKKRKADLAGQLKQAEAKKQKLEELAKSAPEKAAAIAEKQAWNKLEQLAEGEKVKDDVKLLKKTVKRKEKEKQKSAVSWNDRQAHIKKDQEQRQKKREENIKARLEARNAPKGKKGKKPAGKKRPGFEGSMGKRKAGGSK